MVVIFIVSVDINQLWMRSLSLPICIMKLELNYTILICDFILICEFVSRNVFNRFYLYQYHDENLSDYRERFTTFNDV